MDYLFKVVGNKKYQNLFRSDIQKPKLFVGFLKKSSHNFFKNCLSMQQKVYMEKKIQQILNVNLIIICV